MCVLRFVRFAGASDIVGSKIMIKRERIKNGLFYLQYLFSSVGKNGDACDSLNGKHAGARNCFGFACQKLNFNNQTKLFYSPHLSVIMTIIFTQSMRPAVETEAEGRYSYNQLNSITPALEHTHESRANRK